MSVINTRMLRLCHRCHVMTFLFYNMGGGMEEAERMACCQDVLSEKGSVLLLECKYTSPKATAGFTPLLFIFIFFPI